MQIKLCGFTEEESLVAAVKNKCDFLGFVFHDKSPRNLDFTRAKALADLVPNSIKKVAVVVDPSFDFLEKISATLKPDFFQFHGAENIDFLKEVRKKFPLVKIIKAFKIKDKSDIIAAQSFSDFCDFFLFDGSNAGSGEKFNWEFLKDFSGEKPWFLSGGININNIDEALKITGAGYIDISSGIEEIRGKKSVRLIEELMKKILVL